MNTPTFKPGYPCETFGICPVPHICYDDDGISLKKCCKATPTTVGTILAAAHLSLVKRAKEAS